MAETAQRLDEPSVFERQPGQIERQARCAIQDLIELYGPEKAKWWLSYLAEDEFKRVKQ